MNQNLTSFEEADVIFVADMFREEYAGGGELTTDALLQTAPYKTHCLKSSDLTQLLIQQGVQKTWVFFNYRAMNHDLIPFIIQNLHYFVVEYDYKFCNYRSLELHKLQTGNSCDCHRQSIGKFISTFYAGAEHVFFMSQTQRDIHTERFPFLSENTSVLSSVFDMHDLEYIQNLRKTRSHDKNNGKWAIVDGNSWIKGVDESKKLLDERGDDYEVIGGLSYSDLLRKLSEFKGLVSRPIGADTCPRLVIEAKLLGIEIEVNDNVQHFKEDWFHKDLDSIEIYLLEGHNRFWDKLNSHLNRSCKLSGYTQAYNVMKSDYPWRESISSLLGFCDEVVVLDGGSNDGTYEALKIWAVEEPRLVVRQLKRNWDDKRFAVYDGQQKSAARTLCTGEWCWQQDIDEIVHERDYDKIKKLIRQIPKSVSLVCRPVVDYWGKKNKVRVDVHPWKWRLSRNIPHITHGIPANHRRYDEDGDVYSIGSDGCDYIKTDNYEPIPHMNFFTPDHDQIRKNIMTNKEYRDLNLGNYEKFLNAAVDELPSVHHYSWFDIKRKVMTYKNYWSKHWASMYNKITEDIPENNMFFNKKWSAVSDKEIEEISAKMDKELGGWVFHSRVDFENPTPWVYINSGHPKIMKQWLEKHGGNS